jgi:hypothetical protein
MVNAVPVTARYARTLACVAVVIIVVAIAPDLDRCRRRRGQPEFVQPDARIHQRDGQHST